MSAATENDQALEELVEEIAFQKVMLDSIDENTVDREQAEANIKAEMRALDRVLKQLRQGDTSAASSPRPTSSQVLQDKTDGNHTGTSGVTHGLLPSLSSTASTPKSDTTLDYDSAQMELARRKRSHSISLGGERLTGESSSAAKRRAPSPFASAPHTPSSSGDEDFEMFNQHLNQDFFRRQQELEDRLASQKRDADFARSLQSGQLVSARESSSGQKAPSAFEKLSGVRAPQGNNPHTSRTLPGHGTLTSSQLKHEVPGNVSSPMPGTYPAEDSDDDIQIIPKTAFQDNGKYRPRHVPQHSSGVRTAANDVRHRVDQKPEYGRIAISRDSSTSARQHGFAPNDPNLYHEHGLFGGSSSGNFNLAGLSNHDTLYDTQDNMLLGFQHGSFTDPRTWPADYLVGNDSSRYDPYNIAGQVDYVVNDPRKTAQEIQDLLANIRPDSDLPAEDREGTPDGLKYPLYEHQKLALTWMKAMESGTNKGGILADDMGLGKTISTLALILSQTSTDRGRKTTLIVGPVALVRQWEREIKVKVKSSHSLTTYLKHGQSKKPSWDDLRNYDIVLTTYGTLAAEYKRFEKFEAEQLRLGIKEYDSVSVKKKYPLLGPKSLFYRVVLDEAQWIKNKGTVSSRAACYLKSTYRWCLTGTPMQNNIGELFSLVRFLRIKPYNSQNHFNAVFGSLTGRSRPQRRGDREGTMRKFQALIKAILLRRTKTSMIDGKHIINLPPKVEHIKHAVFNEDESDYYKALEARTQIVFNKYVKAGTVGRNYSNMLVLLLRLRQACCHPHLIQDFDEAPAAAQGLIDLAKSLEPDVVARIASAEAFECPVCYDASENPSIVIPCGHDTCSECLSKISDQAAQDNIAAGNGEAAPTYKCPTCRGALQMDKIIDYKTFKQVHMSDTTDAEQATTCSRQDDESEMDSDDSVESSSTSDSEADEYGDLRDFIVPDNIESSDAENTRENEGAVSAGGDKAGAEGKEASEAKPKSKRKHKKRDRKGKQKEREDPQKQHFSIAMMKQEAVKNKAGRRRYMRYLRKNYLPSAKVDQCIELLDQFTRDGQKTIIFSLFVSLLDILQVPIERRGWKCERYDGSMSADARNDAIMRFTDKPDINVMLISLKAGNAGLNLVAASRVIILEPFWNPYVSMQAVDRAYRIGQQKSVEVHHILIEKTVEDRIIELQEQKRELVDAALDEGASKSLARLGERELAFLFGAVR